MEHTSSNPNAPLHIGNLRSVIIGAHLARLLAAVGYDVKQHFYVNDLGAQIGLTALAYSRCYGLLQPTAKIDQWIGCMYAIMNTCQELQKARGRPPPAALERGARTAAGGARQVGVDVGAVEDAAAEGEAAYKALHAATAAAAAGDEKRAEKVDEYFDIFADLRGRYEPMFRAFMPVIRQIKDIKKEAGELNLRYERQEPGAIRIFRKMVTDCLSGIQETLNTYNVRHDVFDFESEFGWEGSNDKARAPPPLPHALPQALCGKRTRRAPPRGARGRRCWRSCRTATTTCRRRSATRRACRRAATWTWRPSSRTRASRRARAATRRTTRRSTSCARTAPRCTRTATSSIPSARRASGPPC